jgi:iron complex outermembrane receptor protein
MSIRQEENIFDVDFQHRFPLGYRHRVIWGIGYRQVADDLLGHGFAVSFSPRKRTTGLFSTFVQDEITLVEDRLQLTLGSKFEENDFTGFEYQPSARLLWTPDRQHSAWAAISRAVRTPSRFDQDGTYTLPRQTVPFPVFPRIVGTPDFYSEELVAYEIGYRTQASKRFAWDLATFVNVYEDLQSARLGTPFIEDGNVIVPLVLNNGLRGQTYGVELAGQWTMSEAWRFSASYSFLQLQLHSVAGTGYDEERRVEGSSPHNQVRLWSSWDLPRCWQLDLGLRYVDNLPVLHVGSYISMDLRLAWVPSENLEVAVVGQNLLDSHHLEFYNDFAGPYLQGTEVERGVFAKITWKY